MIRKTIFILGSEKEIIACDENCEKAWGINHRPKIQFDPDNDDDYAFLADNELGIAPEDPGVYEGGCAKPREKKCRLNKWCYRECERSSWFKIDEYIMLTDFSKRVYNIPDKHNDYGG